MEIFRQVFSPIEVNTYILADRTGVCAIIDCGCYGQKEFEKLVSFIESKNLKPVLLLNTHCHLDHVFGNKAFFDKYGLKSRYHELEEPYRTGAPSHALRYGLQMEEPPASLTFISHGEEIAFGSTTLLALHVPGHTTGSLSFYSASDGCVFTGDALFAGSIGRTDFPGGDHKLLIESIRKNLLTLPDDTVVYAGHGPETTIGREKRSNPYLL